MQFSIGQEVWLMNLILVICEFVHSFKRTRNNIENENSMLRVTNDIITYYNITKFYNGI